jgi:hypothetical protein
MSFEGNARAEYRYTVIIPVTHNLVDLKDCLDSLERLDYPRELFHAVLIDCQVVEGLREFFRIRLAGYGFHLTTLTLPQTASKHKSWLHEARVNEARNAAIDQVPASFFIFTEDDCIFEPDWLRKFDSEVTADMGALGGPDLLPDGMQWLPRALDVILQLFIGTAGAKRGGGLRQDWYYPRKENVLIPAEVIARIGKFPESLISGAEMEMARRIRQAGLSIKYLPNNPVWHRRNTTFTNFVRRNAYHSAEKVRLLRREGAFSRSPHFLVFVAVIAGLLILAGALIASAIRPLLLIPVAAYILLVLLISIYSLISTRSLSVGLGTALLLPSHHLSITFGILKGALSNKAR